MPMYRQRKFTYTGKEGRYYQMVTSIVCMEYIIIADRFPCDMYQFL